MFDLYLEPFMWNLLTLMWNLDPKPSCGTFLRKSLCEASWQTFLWNVCVEPLGGTSGTWIIPWNLFLQPWVEPLLPNISQRLWWDYVEPLFTPGLRRLGAVLGMLRKYTGEPKWKGGETNLQPNAPQGANAPAAKLRRGGARWRKSGAKQTTPHTSTGHWSHRERSQKKFWQSRNESSDHNQLGPHRQGADHGKRAQIDPKGPRMKQIAPPWQAPTMPQAANQLILQRRQSWGVPSTTQSSDDASIAQDESLAVAPFSNPVAKRCKALFERKTLAPLMVPFGWRWPLHLEAV